EAGTYYFLKSDVFKRLYWYTFKGDTPSGLVALPVDVVKNVQRMNRKGEKPERLLSEENEAGKKIEDTFLNMVGQEDLNRFDRPKTNPRKKRRKTSVHDRKNKPVHIKKIKDR